MSNKSEKLDYIQKTIGFVFENPISHQPGFSEQEIEEWLVTAQLFMHAFDYDLCSVSGVLKEEVFWLASSASTEIFAIRFLKSETSLSAEEFLDEFEKESFCSGHEFVTPVHDKYIDKIYSYAQRLLLEHSKS